MQVFFIIDGGLDYDILWHIKQGQVYIENGITTQDYLSWQPNLTWTTAEWLYEVIIYLIYKYTGTIGFISVLTVSTYTVYGWQAIKNKLEHPFIFFTIFAITFLFPRNIYNRPGELQIIITLWILHRAIQNSDRLVIEGAITGLFLANFHGGQLIVALTLMGILIAVNLVHIIANRDYKKEELDRFKKLVAQTGLMAVCSLLNPMGIEVYSVALKVPSMYSTMFINEWQPWNIGYIAGVLVLLTIIQVASQKRFNEFELNTLQILAILQALQIASIKTQRVAGYLAQFIIVFCYEYIIEFYTSTIGKIANKEVTVSKPSNQEISRQSAIIYSIIIAGILIFDGVYLCQQTNGLTSLNKVVDKNTEFQGNIVQYLKENEITQNILTGYTQGCWLIWNDLKQFVDSRQQPFTKEIQDNEQLDDLIHAVRGPQVSKDIQSLCDKYNIEFILWSNAEMGCDIQADLIDTGNWEIVLEDTVKAQKEYLIARVK